MAKLLPNINKSVPQPTDPALIQQVSDAIEAVDQAIGAKPSTLETTAKTIVPAINELKANSSLLPKKMIAGNVLVSDIPVNGSKSLNVPITGFATAPQVVATIMSGGPQLYDVGISSVTTSDFTVTVFNRHTSEASVRISFMVAE